MEMNDLVEFKSTPEIREKLKKYGITKKFSEDDIILNENAYIKAIPIVINGSIKVMRTDEDGREILLYYIRPGESCIMSFLGGIHNDTSKVIAIAEEPTEILFIPIDKVNELIREYPEWLDYIFRLYHRRFEELLEVVNAVAFKKMDERLLAFIKKKSEMTNNKVINVTHEQLANELGTVRVVISRLLKQMEEEGLVELGRNKITLVN
ncbi:MAG: Crp/Fnr family transcriptional regulator [Bacteroidetes bacterium]|nr:Crp/Fnr family transcriptional regulator [Bacteroidota bacterium]MBK8362444.1 Crp/Fnr family transcriptional regulator [Bacteroidota bacterium]MBK9412846.1 Crp/Fnr family transcriptional regulator [Bacteroidota bacterium]MBP6425968.1 Crp/Fnr family transcriptional regulator [Bacteroidia bacterium]MBP6657529.1 Crp/Fnr family transcriptional regulator [Bacteroidia bacterium]